MSKEPKNGEVYYTTLAGSVWTVKFLDLPEHLYGECRHDEGIVTVDARKPKWRHTLFHELVHGVAGTSTPCLSFKTEEHVAIIMEGAFGDFVKIPLRKKP